MMKGKDNQKEEIVVAIRQLCVNEITSVTATVSQTVTCTDPAFTPVGAGNECNVALYNVTVDLGATPPTLAFSYDVQFEYQYLTDGGVTFSDYCTVVELSGAVTLPGGTSVCCAETPAVTYSASCNPGSITTTPTSVSGSIDLSFSVSNLCVPTIICVEDTLCP